jgi:hypothetical protein
MNNDSSWTGGHDSPLDRAIDRAVREIMQVDPPHGLRRRVLSRIATDGSARKPLVLRFAWVGAALAMVIAAVIYTSQRSTERPSVQTEASQSAAIAAPAPAPAAAPQAVPPSVAPSSSTPRPRPSRTTREAIPMPRVGNVFGASRGAAAANVPAERVWTPVSSPSGSSTVAVPPLEIRPLSAMPIDMPALVVLPIQVPESKSEQER